MKTKLWVKFVAFILVIAAAFCFAFSGLGLLWSGINQTGLFADSSMYTDISSQYIDYAWQLFELDYLDIGDSDQEKQELELNLSNTNFYFSISDRDTGEVILSNDPKTEAKFTFNAGNYGMDDLIEVNQNFNYYYYSIFDTDTEESEDTEPQEEAEAAESSDEALTPLEQALEKQGYEMLVYDGVDGLERVESNSAQIRSLALCEALYGVTPDNELVLLDEETTEEIIRDMELLTLREGGDNTNSEDWEETSEDENVEHVFVMNWGTLSTYKFQDDFSSGEVNYITAKNQQVLMVVLAIVSGVVGVAGTIWLCYASGWRKGEETVTVYGYHKWWLDLMLVFYLGGLVCCWGSVELLMHSLLNWWKLGMMAGACTLAAVLTLPMLCTVVVRLRTHTLLKSTACYGVIHWGWNKLSHPVKSMDLTGRARGLWVKAHENLSLAARVAGLYVVYCVVDLVILNPRNTVTGVVLWTLLHLLLFGVVELWALDFWNIRKGVEQIASGNVDYKIQTEKMPADLKQLSAQLNHISEGVAIAVEERMKSERFKAELITNVSHDLKTPLTSIINYIDLLKKENVDNPTAREYIEVLDRKSQRLKKLTEDLVDASKASTGAMPTKLEALNLNQLVNQALGEYDEKLSGKQLVPMVTLPEEPVMVLADGRHLWRVMDNLLGNCVKYAMPGTRIYLAVATQGTEAILTVKNISEQPLNLTEEELMERFVRGDASRTTEGSGLGLSIARSLMELQKGGFCIKVDGDLFKAIITVPLRQNTETE